MTIQVLKVLVVLESGSIESQSVELHLDVQRQNLSSTEIECSRAMVRNNLEYTRYACLVYKKYVSLYQYYIYYIEQISIRERMQLHRG